MIAAQPELNVPMTPNDRVVRGVGVAVLRALGRIPLGGLSGRVVARLEGDVVVAGLPPALLELEADRRDDLLGLVPRRALEREVGGEQVIGIALALVLERRARGRRQRRHLGAAPVVVATTAGSDERERGNDQRECGEHTLLCSQPVLLTSIHPVAHRLSRRARASSALSAT